MSDGRFSRLRRVVGPMLAPIYGWVLRARNAKFDRAESLGTERRVPMRVMSIGNLTTGGTGKTPVTMWVVERLIQMGQKPGIALRGYTGLWGSLFGSGGNKSDEAELYRQRLEGVEVLVGADRHATITSAIARGSTLTCVVLDDGFAHRRLKRDVNIVLIDATAGTLDDRLLPWGNLREPIEGLRRADGVIFTHGNKVTAQEISEQRARVLKICGREIVIGVCEHRWTGAQSIVRGRVGVEMFKGANVFATVGLGEPRHFLEMLASHGAKISGQRILPDHGMIDVARTVREAKACRAEMIVMSEKDFARLDEQDQRAEAWGGIDVVRPVLGISFMEGEQELVKLLERAAKN